MADVRIGLIGLGDWTQQVHIPNLLRTPGARISALSTRSPERLQAATAMVTAGAPRGYADYRALLADAEVDAVVISTPNHTHETIAVEALQVGKHVLCEKPLSFSLEGCQRVRAAAERSGKVFQVGLELRYADVADKMREVIASGELGAVRMAQCTIWRDWGAPQGWRAGADTSGGIYLELAVHYLDLLDWLVGGGAARVYAAGGQALNTPITDYLFTTTTYAAGPQVNLGICVFAPAENLIPIEVVGDRARLVGDIITGQVQVWRRDGVVQDVSPPRPAGYRFDGFPGSQESVDAFVQAILRGCKPIADIDAATRATALAVAAGESEQTGIPVSVPAND